MTLLTALLLLATAPFTTVSHDVQCRSIGTLVEYRLDPDQHIHEDVVAEVLGIDTVLDYSYPSVIGYSTKECTQ